MVQRLTFRKRHSYATKSNQHWVVKTPGGKLVYHTTKKTAGGPKCPVTGKRIQGVTRQQHIFGSDKKILLALWLGCYPQISFMMVAEFVRRSLLS